MSVIFSVEDYRATSAAVLGLERGRYAVCMFSDVEAPRFEEVDDIVVCLIFFYAEFGGLIEDLEVVSHQLSIEILPTRGIPCG